MSMLQSMHYKQCSPESTVNLLKNTLSNMGVEVEETWQEQSAIGTYALRLDFKGTHIGSNGKGTTPAYAQASAYAEFFERYQNDILGPRVSFGDRFPFYIAPDEKIRSSEEIVKDDNDFINQYFKLRRMQDASEKKKAKAFYDVQKVDYIIYGLDNRYITLPFYSVKKGENVYLPKSTYTPFYGSNGMCAGNSTEEALVQGLSEIIERVVQRKIFLEKPCLPDVPDEYIKKFPYVYEILEKLKQQEKHGYKFFIKDCSFGGKFPVAALIVYEENSGRYGIKLGCHPDFGVAIERTLTEATQGQDLSEYAKRSVIDFRNNHVDNWKNIYNSYKFGMGQYPYQLFNGKPTYSFTPVKDVSGMDNRSILKEWVDEIVDAGYDIFIRNVSYLGFPSFHIIVPGLSEMLYPDDLQFRATNTRYYLSNVLRDTPEKIDKTNSKLFIATMGYFLGNAYENTMESYYGVVDPMDIPCENIHCGCTYMIAMCHVLLGEYDAASQKMDFILKLAEAGLKDETINKNEYTVLLATKYYIDAMHTIKDHAEVMEYMRKLFDVAVCTRLDELFSGNENLIAKQYPGITKNGVSHRDKYIAMYDAIARYTVALRTMQMQSQIDQNALKLLV